MESVRKAANRITTQLIDAMTGVHIWTERFDRGLEDIFAVQDEITMMLATEIARTVIELTTVYPAVLQDDRLWPVAAVGTVKDDVSFRRKSGPIFGADFSTWRQWRSSPSTHPHRPLGGVTFPAGAGGDMPAHKQALAQSLRASSCRIS